MITAATVRRLAARAALLVIVALLGGIAAYSTTAHLHTDARAWCVQFPHFEICNVDAMNE